MPRPRQAKIVIPNLYRRYDKRNGKVYWQYKSPMDGRFYGLGVDILLALKDEDSYYIQAVA